MRTAIKGHICRALQAFAVLVMAARRGVLKSSGATRLLPAFAGSVLLGVLTACGGGGSATSSSPASGVQLQSCASIMPLGDSITLGVNGGYRNDLYTGLQQNNCGVSYVGTESDQWTRVADKDHEGHSGFTIAGIAGSVNAWMASTQPDIILLMIGTNDIAWGAAENAGQIGARHNALIEQLRTTRPNASIFVASIPPQSSTIIEPIHIDRAALTQQLNDVIKSNVEARVALGQRVRFVDVNSALTTADLYDGIHPTEAAHAMVAQKFLEAIRAALGSA